ncbi:hypothetical protein [Sinomonas sp.]|jgi:hypothetical protein|uniref:hypothetical protein n=1 Tax=Sinomonas sp. TaxID=1914986 RepID=UPI002FDFB4FA
MSESTTDGGRNAQAGDAQPGEPPRPKGEGQPAKVEMPQQVPADRAQLRQEPGARHSRLGHFMRTMGHLRSIYGPAAHRDLDEEAAYGHNPEDLKESHELDGIEVQTDSEGHRYGVRKPSDGDQPAH